MTLDPFAVKANSERIILAAGGQTLDLLPIIGQTGLRKNSELISRSLILNALINIHFNAPTGIIKAWVEKHQLTAHLSVSERDLLTKENQELSEQERVNLFWYIEALWALMWAGSLIDELPVDRPVEDYMASLTPNVQLDEGTEKFSERMRLRPHNDLYAMLDLYYRAHWYARNAQLNGKPSGNFSIDVIMERRRSLEWLLDPKSDWDNTNSST